MFTKLYKENLSISIAKGNMARDPSSLENFWGINFV